MKKTLISLIAILTLSSCDKDIVIDQKKKITKDAKIEYITYKEFPYIFSPVHELEVTKGNTKTRYTDYHKNDYLIESFVEERYDVIKVYSEVESDEKILSKQKEFNQYLNELDSSILASLKEKRDYVNFLVRD